MKHLMSDTEGFWYKIFSKNVESLRPVRLRIHSGLSGYFINVEKEDEDQKDKVVKKVVNYII